MLGSSVIRLIGGNRRGLRGFTLIEIMVVVLIIVTLIAILIPVVGAMREKARIAATRERMGTISSGLDAYKQQIGYYPQSTPGTFINQAGAGSVTLNSGSAMVAEALLGYLDGNFDGCGPALTVDAGALNFGWRKVNGKGEKFGPYTDINALPRTNSGTFGTIKVDTINVVGASPALTSPRMVYVDSFGNDILYYKATGKDVLVPKAVFGSPNAGDSNAAVFVNSDNANLAGTVYDPASTGTAQFFNKIMAGMGNTASPATVFGRDQYILISAGKDLIYFNDDDVAAPAR